MNDTFQSRDSQRSPRFAPRGPSTTANLPVDLRPKSPAQVAVAGLVLCMVALIFHALGVLMPLGVALLVVAAVGQLLKPHTRRMYWRDRWIELDGEPSAATRLYRAVFKS
jgi:hypothetical protein